MMLHEASDHKIKALIFDLGGVVFNYTFNNTFDYWSKVSGVSADELKKRSTFGESFEQLERGEIEPSRFAEQVAQQLGISLSLEDFTTGWNSIYLDIIPGIDDLLQELKSHYRIVALTNTNIIHATVWPSKYADTLKHFEQVFSSHQIHARKPESRAFEIVLNYLQLSPAETIFIDDKEEYTRGAEQAGIHSVQCSSLGQMKRDLQNMLHQS